MKKSIATRLQTGNAPAHHLIPPPTDSAYASAPGIDPRYQRALRLMQRDGNEAAAYPLLSAAADDGDGMSIYAIATWLLHGTHVRRNLKEGNRLLRLAADKNIASACSDLAVSYYRGWGIRQSYNEAARYYLRAFLLGDVAAAEWIEKLFYWEGTKIAPRTVAREFGRLQAARGL